LPQNKGVQNTGALLIIAAFAFALITGANDGASLIALNLGSRAMRPLTALLILTGAVAFGPLILGTAVASTLAIGLTRFSASGGSDALLLALIVTVAVMAAWSRLGLPSSVTQALTGAIIGIGIGRGLPVDGAAVIRVLVILALAPIAAGLLGMVAALLLERTRPAHNMRRHLGRLQAVSFGAQCAGYAANDAQKMVAVAAIAFGLIRANGVEAILPVQLLIAGAFFVGTCIGVAGLGGRITKLLPAHPLQPVSAGFASASVVIGSALAGSPVSMAQAQTSALVGSETVLESYRRVRWEQAGRILSVWFTTLPTAIAAAALVGLATR
jgi:PiT family inorganic phosphate transporter